MKPFTELLRRKENILTIEINDKVNVLIADIKKIRLKELQDKNYVKVHDEQYLLDKISQLGVMRDCLNALIEIMRENPSDQDYEGGVLDTVFADLNKMIDSMNRIKGDDDQLRRMYEQLKG